MLVQVEFHLPFFNLHLSLSLLSVSIIDIAVSRLICLTFTLLYQTNMIKKFHLMLTDRQKITPRYIFRLDHFLLSSLVHDGQMKNFCYCRIMKVQLCKFLLLYIVRKEEKLSTKSYCYNLFK